MRDRLLIVAYFIFVGAKWALFAAFLLLGVVGALQAQHPLGPLGLVLIIAGVWAHAMITGYD